MQLIATREEEFIDPVHKQGPAYHSFDPQDYPRECCHIPPTSDEARIPANVDREDRDHGIRGLAAGKRFLPCHYFDYIGGTSTGGYESSSPDTRSG